MEIIKCLGLCNVIPESCIITISIALLCLAGLTIFVFRDIFKIKLDKDDEEDTDDEQPDVKSNYSDGKF